MQVSSKVFSILKERGISQKEFSKMTGIAESTICDWKRKGFNPSAGKLSVICKALDISPIELFYDENISKSESTKSSTFKMAFSDDEKLIIEIYRNSDSDLRKRILSYFTMLSSNNSSNNANSTEDIDSISVVDNNKYSLTQSASFIPETKELSVKKSLCKRLRRLARLDRIKLDESEHVSGLNLHLFKYLDFLGIDKLVYIRKYLEHIQPFMITEVSSQEKFDNAVCVLDEFYRISVYIKVDATKGEELIVSFHENNKNGIAKRNPLRRTDEKVYVYPETISSHVVGSDQYTVNLLITRGVTTLPISISAHKYDDEGFLVNLNDISRALIETANSYLQDLYTADMDYSAIEPFYSLQQISFTSYGTDIFSSISLLVDSLLIQMSPMSKQVADAALCIYCNTIELTGAAKKELLETLRDRYKVNSVRALPEILERIELNIYSE